MCNEDDDYDDMARRTEHARGAAAEVGMRRTTHEERLRAKEEEVLAYEQGLRAREEALYRQENRSADRGSSVTEERMLVALEAIAKKPTETGDWLTAAAAARKKITTTATVQKLEGTGKSVELHHVLRFASRNVAVYASEHRCHELYDAVTAIRQQVKAAEAIMQLDTEVLRAAYYPEVHA